MLVWAVFSINLLCGVCSGGGVAESLDLCCFQIRRLQEFSCLLVSRWKFCYPLSFLIHFDVHCIWFLSYYGLEIFWLYKRDSPSSLAYEGIVLLDSNGKIRSNSTYGKHELILFNCIENFPTWCSSFPHVAFVQVVYRVKRQLVKHKYRISSGYLLDC